jgi:transcriptional regulator GlxA family with amidase domain
VNGAAFDVMDLGGARMTGRLHMHIAIPLFPRFTALDAIGPYEVLAQIPTFDITFIGHAKGEVRDGNGMLGLTIDATFEDLPSPDVIVFPGGDTRLLQSDARVLDWLRGAHASTIYTTSVCTGSLVLGAAGLLDGLTATTHWARYADLAACGATPAPERVIEHLDQRIITAAGVSAGIDMALRLTELLADRTAAQAAQLLIEYDPQPPVDCGARPKATDEVMARVREYDQPRH